MLGGKYVVGERVGKGAFGQVFLCEDTATGQKLAMKEQKNSNEYEYRVLLALRNTGIVPKTSMYFEQGDLSYLCMQRMGIDLRTLSRRCVDHTLPPRLLLSVAAKLIAALKKVHDMGFVHRDVKPGNIMFDDVGSGAVYLVDFGLAKRYKLCQSGQHIPFLADKKTVVGTAKYMSVWAHAHVQSSRRDDMASMMYSLIKVGKGTLPWGEESCGKDAKKRLRRVHKIKRRTSADTLCRGLPPSLKRIMLGVESMQFSARPPYSEWQHLLVRDWAAG
jgi:serine/threonine protein kinase